MNDVPPRAPRGRLPAVAWSRPFGRQDTHPLDSLRPSLNRDYAKGALVRRLNGSRRCRRDGGLGKVPDEEVASILIFELSTNKPRNTAGLSD